MLIAGLVRPYKGLADKKEVLASCLGSGRARRLLVAGSMSCGQTRAMLRELPVDRVTVVDRFIGDDELQVFFNAASFVLLSYRDVLTSGSLMESFSFGRPVLAPAMGSIPYYVAHSFNGWTYRNNSELADLLRMIGDGNDRLLRMAENCLAAANSARWPG